MVASRFVLLSLTVALSPASGFSQETPPASSAKGMLATARALSRQFKEEKDEVHASRCLAAAANSLGDLQARDEELQRAFARLERSRHVGSATNELTWLARDYLEYRNHAGAKKAIEKAGEFCKEIDSLFARSENFAFLAGLSFRAQDQAGWEKYSQSAREAALAIGEKHNDTEEAKIQEHYVRCTALAAAWKFDEALAVPKEWMGDRHRGHRCAMEFAVILRNLALKKGWTRADAELYEDVYRLAQHYLARGAIAQSTREKILFLLTLSDIESSHAERGWMGSVLLEDADRRAICMGSAIGIHVDNPDIRDVSFLLSQFPTPESALVRGARPIMRGQARWSSLSADQLLKELAKRGAMAGSRENFFGVLGIAEGLHLRAVDQFKGIPKRLEHPKAGFAPSERPVFDPLLAPTSAYWRTLAEGEMRRPSVTPEPKQKEPNAFGKKEPAGDNACPTAIERARLWTMMAKTEPGRAPENKAFRTAIREAKNACLEAWTELALKKHADQRVAQQIAMSAQPVLHALLDIQDVQVEAGDILAAQETLLLLAKASEILPPHGAHRFSPGIRAHWLAVVAGRWVRMNQKDIGEAWLNAAKYAVTPNLGHSDYTKQTHLLDALMAAEAGDLKRCREQADFLKSLPRRVNHSAPGYATFAYGQLALAALRNRNPRESMDAVRAAFSLESADGVLPIHLLPAVEAMVASGECDEGAKWIRAKTVRDTLYGESLGRIAAILARHGEKKLTEEVLRRMQPNDNHERVWHAQACSRLQSRDELQKQFDVIRTLNRASERAAWYLGTGQAVIQSSAPGGKGASRIGID